MVSRIGSITPLLVLVDHLGLILYEYKQFCVHLVHHKLKQKIFVNLLYLGLLESRISNKVGSVSVFLKKGRIRICIIKKVGFRTGLIIQILNPMRTGVGYGFLPFTQKIFLQPIPEIS